MQLLTDKVIFLTGGSTGIGLECAKAYAAEGAKVVLLASSEGPVQAAAKTLGDEHMGIVCDVANAGEVEKAMQATLSRYGKINAIHNNAGIAAPSKPLHETTDEEWDRVMNVNLKSVLYTTRFGFEALKESKGCILNTSSLVGEIGQDNHAAYTATKGALNVLTKSMALDYAPYGIRVNAVLPAGVWTPMLRSWSREQPDPVSIEKYLNDIHPMGYCPDGDVIADACVFLISDKARFVTGANLPVSGGAELGYRSVR
ncbi:SDR family NAD(P)-dependent oxidoreductase [Pedobacter psychroterrae]|uniref:SDR family oxidoreductase n=1 Tax=Pedobacter psychroterrae TaxID=2530453 RepID=A0A4R0NUT4_9SPHI|nr:SDR family oxidoreductase [Pedobacter psychroterrae]TCD03265.1 SDR family oxidoreductase [Pedobacter psychroterrae]